MYRLIIDNVALVAGANGVIGSNLIAHLESLKDWKIIGLSRRGGKNTSKTTYIAVDLLQGDECEKKLKDLTGITHIFYAAYQHQDT